MMMSKSEGLNFPCEENSFSLTKCFQTEAKKLQTTRGSTHNFNNCLQVDEHDRSYLRVSSMQWKTTKLFMKNLGCGREYFSSKHEIIKLFRLINYHLPSTVHPQRLYTQIIGSLTTLCGGKRNASIAVINSSFPSATRKK